MISYEMVGEICGRKNKDSRGENALEVVSDNGTKSDGEVEDSKAECAQKEANRSRFKG
jgi:hypothetical protein